MSFNFGTYNPASVPNYTSALGYGQQQGFGFGNFGMQNGFNWNQQQQYASVVPNQGMAMGMGPSPSPMQPFQQPPMNTWGDNSGGLKGFQQPSGSYQPSQGGDVPMGMNPYGSMPQAMPTAPSAQAFYGGGIKLLSVTPITPHPVQPHARGCGMRPMLPHAGTKFY